MPNRIKFLFQVRYFVHRSGHIWVVHLLYSDVVVILYGFDFPGNLSVWDYSEVFIDNSDLLILTLLLSFWIPPNIISSAFPCTSVYNSVSSGPERPVFFGLSQVTWGDELRTSVISNRYRVSLSRRSLGLLRLAISWRTASAIRLWSSDWFRLSEFLAGSGVLNAERLKPCRGFWCT